MKKHTRSGTKKEKLSSTFFCVAGKQTNKWFKLLKITHNYYLFSFIIIQLSLSRARFWNKLPNPGVWAPKNYYSTEHCPFHLSCLIGCCSTSLPPKFVAVVVVAGVIVVVTVPDSPPRPSPPFSSLSCFRTGCSSCSPPPPPPPFS